MKDLLEIKTKHKLNLDSINYLIYIIKTKKFRKNINYVSDISSTIRRAFNLIKENGDKKKWFVVISEKVIAVSQGRSYLIKDINPRFFARILYRFVKKNPYGIGLRSPWTMELAIKEAGITKIIYASIISAITRPFGIKGLFYSILGRKIASIDGPTKYSIYPSNVSAKLGPLNPEETTVKIQKEIIANSSVIGFSGVVILDANDLGRDVLGNSTNIDNQIIEELFKSNPMGQSDEQTPLSIVFF